MKTRFRGNKLLTFAIVIILTGAAGWFFAALNSSTPNQKAEVITYSTETPDETKPNKNYEWRGDPDDPKYIHLPTIQTEGFIQSVGVDQNKQIAVPNNIHIAGWFSKSVKPGQKGLSIIDGHLNGRNSDGIFVNLQSIQTDDTFTIEFGDGSAKQFKVTGITTVATKDAPNVLFSQNPKATHQLNLITCDGNFDPNSRLYDKRVVVSSELVQ